MSAETAHARQARRSELYWGSVEEKEAMVQLAVARGHGSLNAYILYLARQDQRAHGNGRLASLERVHAAAAENRLGDLDEGNH